MMKVKRTHLFLLICIFISLCDICYSTIEIKNEFISLKVIAVDGGFVLATTGGDPKIKTDDNKNLMFERWGNVTSNTTIMIDDKEYVFGKEKGDTIELSHITEKNTVETEWKTANISVRQKLKFVSGKTTGNQDTVRIEYVIINKDNAPHKIGVRVLLDTLLGNNDGAPFSVPGYGEVSTDTAFEKDKMPEYWYAFDNLKNPTVRSQATLRLPNYPVPDRIIFSNYDRIFQASWNVYLKEGRKFVNGINLDSAVAVYWDPKFLEPEKSFDYAISYGLYGAVVETSEAYDMALGCPVKSRVNQPFTLTCDVQNKRVAAQDIVKNFELTVDLPPNEELAVKNVDEKTKKVAEFKPQQLEKASWVLIPKKDFVGKVKISVTAKGKLYVPPKMVDKTLTVTKEINIYSALMIGPYQIDEANRKIKKANDEVTNINTQLNKLKR